MQEQLWEFGAAKLEVVVTRSTQATRVADSEGRVCASSELVRSSALFSRRSERPQDGRGCCAPGASAEACLDCSAERRCCASYEHCLACCVTADSTLRAEVRARASHALLALATDDWELCRFRCLTNSGSVLQQNSYRSVQKHCYGVDRPPLDLANSVNSVDPRLEPDTLDLDLTDPYVANRRKERSNASRRYVFPCRVEGCAVPEQDRSVLHGQRAKAASTPRKVGAARGKKKQTSKLRHGSRGVPRREE